MSLWGYLREQGHKTQNNEYITTLSDIQNEVTFRFSLLLNIGGIVFMTKATPEVKMSFTGIPPMFSIVGINVYQGEKGEEILTNVIKVGN